MKKMPKLAALQQFLKNTENENQKNTEKKSGGQAESLKSGTLEERKAKIITQLQDYAQQELEKDYGKQLKEKINALSTTDTIDDDFLDTNKNIIF